MRKLRQLITWKTLLMLMFVLTTTTVFGQEESPAPLEPTAFWEFIGLLTSGGLVVALLQLFRRVQLLSLIPAFLRPIVAGGVGIGATWLTSYVLTNFGVELDLSAIVAFFGAGGGATALFSMGKEVNLLNHFG